MRRMGVVLSPFGAPLAARPVEVRNNATGALVTTGATDSNGRWEFTLADESVAYKVEVGLGGASPQKVAQAPASIELEYLFVRYGATLPAGTTINGQPLDPANPAQPYVRKAGDTMTGDLTLGYGAPRLVFNETDAAADNRLVALYQPSGDGRLRLGALNDAGVLGASFIDITRSGNNLAQIMLNGAVTINAPQRGHRLGALGATAFTGGVLDTDASIYLYRNDANNWSGIGGDASGNMWWRAGLSGAPAPALVVTPIPVGVAVQGRLSQSGDYAYLGAVNSQAYPRQGIDLAVGWNFSGGQSEMSLWNTVFGSPIAFAFRQLTSAGSRNDLVTFTWGDYLFQGNTAGATTIRLSNLNQGASNWAIFHQGSAGNIGPVDSLTIAKSGGTGPGTHLSIRSDGRVAIGAQAPTGSAAQLDVQASSGTTFAFICRAGVGAANALSFFRAHNAAGTVVLGANNLGWVTDVAFDMTSFNSPLRALPVYNSAGTFMGYIPLYRTYN